MILGIGADLCDIRRIRAALDRHGDRFTRRVFTPKEIARCADRRDAAACYAKRWAAKEAAAKALGGGLPGPGSLKEIAVASNPRGRPLLRLEGWAAADLAALTPPGMSARLHLTLTDDDCWAQAFVVIEALRSETES